MRKSLFGGYPHEGIKSLEVFPNRIPTKIVDNKVQAEIAENIWGNPGETLSADFLLNRIHDYNSALSIAEKQISDMDQEYPFLPEDFNFKETEVVDDGLGTPMRFYEKDGFLLARAKDKWLLTPSMSAPIYLSFPNAQIAFITLRALGVITDEEFEGPVEYIVHQSEVTKEEIDAEIAKREKTKYLPDLSDDQKKYIDNGVKEIIKKKEGEK